MRRQLGNLRRWGWPGAIGLLAGTVSLFIAQLWLPELQRERDTIREAADLAQRRARQRLAPARAVDAAPSGADDFRGGFPPASQRQERLAALLASATQHGLASRRIELRLSQDVPLGLARYSVTTPIVGSYAALRAFVEDAPARDPALSLDRLQMRRASVAAGAIEAELSWSLYMRAEAPLKLAASHEARR
jgi:hypothetical protein